MKILIVEDNPEKLRHVIHAVLAGGGTDEGIHVAHDAREAKLKTAEQQYDLMILDLVIPAHPSALPEQDGGVKLLAELRERDRFNMPREVVGLTAFDVIKAESAEMFADSMWSIVTYDPSSDAWSDQLARKVSHLLIASRGEVKLAFDCHLCLITALPMELEAVLRFPWGWAEFERSNDVTMYWRGQVQTRRGSKVVFAASASRMGMTATATLTTKMIEAFRPEFVGMVGIAAGVKGRCELGDVIMADPSWDWGSGKHSAVDGTQEFAPAPHQLPISSSMRMRVDRLVKQPQILDEIRRRWPGETPGSPLRILTGPVASGSSVLADREKISTIERQHRKLLAIEMEAYGLYAAVSDSRVPQPTAFSMKAVSDFADEEKNDSFQKYAAYTSAETMRVLIEQFT